MSLFPAYKIISESVATNVADAGPSSKKLDDGQRTDKKISVNTQDKDWTKNESYQIKC